MKKYRYLKEKGFEIHLREPYYLMQEEKMCKVLVICTYHPFFVRLKGQWYICVDFYEAPFFLPTSETIEDICAIREEAKRYHRGK